VSAAAEPKGPSPGPARRGRVEGRPRARRPRRRDLGRALALVLSVLFAVIGAVPLAFGALARTERVRVWAAAETARLLRDELGVTASYRLRVEPWPLRLALEDVEVPSNDGGGPFLAAERVDVRPRIFSLLGGRLDAGEIEIVAPRVRAVVRAGVLVNVDYRLPKTEKKTTKTEPPALALGLTDGHVDLTIDDLRLITREVDLDLGVEPRAGGGPLGAAIDVALRVGSGSLARVRAVPGRPFEQAIDEDRLCRLDLRARVVDDEIVVRRFSLEAAVDLDPALGTAPACVLPRDDWRRLEVELGGVRVQGALALATGTSTRLPSARGRVHLALPLPVVHRFLSLPHVTGQLRFDGTVAHDGRALLPEVEGALRLVEPGIDGKLFSSTIDGQLRVDAESVTLADALARWANGEVRIPHAEVRPLEPGVPIETGPIDVKGVDLPGLLRDLGVHPRTHVSWTLSEAHFEGFSGTLSPLSLESPLDVATRDFAIYTRPTYHPQKKRMMGVREGTVKGTFKVTPEAVLLSQMQVDTGRSKLRASVSLGFKNLLGVDVYDGATLDLADITPLVDIPLAGKARLRVNVAGPFDHPVLRGELSVTDFMFGGFPIGDVETAKVFFEPLDVVLTDARVKRGESVVRVPELKLDFDAGAAVLADAKVETVGASLEVSDLFHMLRFDEDPRWEGIAGRVAGTARIHYALDGREDRCGGGYLSVSSRVHATRAELFGERFDGGEADLDLVWDDFAAGGQGMRIDVRAARLRKGDGAILAEAFVRHGGLLRGTVVGSGVPLAKLDAMGALGPKLDATVGLLGELSGTLSQIEGRFDVNVMPVRIGPATLPASRMTLRMEPGKVAPRVLGRTRCGNPRTAEFDRAEYDKDLPDGAFVASGSLLGGQVELRDVRISKQRSKVVTGQLGVRKLDLGALSNLVPGVAFAEKPPKGDVSATVDLKRVPLASLGSAEVDVRLEGFSLERSGLRAKLLGAKGSLSLSRDKLTVPTLELEGSVKSGLRAKFQVGGEVRGVTSRPELELALKLAPTDLSVLAADIPALSRATGTVVADLTVSGPPSALRYGGLAKLRGGELKLAGLAVGVTELDFDVVVDRGEARLERGKGRVGGGTIAFGGRVPIRGLELGDAEATLVARAVRVPIAEGITVTTDADLDLSSRRPAVAGGERPLPFVKGQGLARVVLVHQAHRALALARRSRAEERAHGRRDLRSLARRRGLRPVDPGRSSPSLQQQPHRHAARGRATGAAGDGHQPALWRAGAAAHLARVEAEAQAERVRRARGHHPLRRPRAREPPGRSARDDRAPTLRDRRQRAELGVERRGGAERQPLGPLAHPAARDGRARGSQARVLERSAPRARRRDPAAHHGDDSRRARSRPRLVARRDRRPRGALVAHGRRSSGEEHHPAHRRVPLRLELLDPQRAHRADRHARQAHHRLAARDGDHHAHREPRGALQPRVAPLSRASACRGPTTTSTTRAPRASATSAPIFVSGWSSSERPLTTRAPLTGRRAEGAGLAGARRGALHGARPGVRRARRASPGARRGRALRERLARERARVGDRARAGPVDAARDLFDLGSRLAHAAVARRGRGSPVDARAPRVGHRGFGRAHPREGRRARAHVRPLRRRRRSRAGRAAAARARARHVLRERALLEAAPRARAWPGQGAHLLGREPRRGTQTLLGARQERLRHRRHGEPLARPCARSTRRRPRSSASSVVARRSIGQARRTSTTCAPRPRRCSARPWSASRCSATRAGASAVGPCATRSCVRAMARSCSCTPTSRGGRRSRACVMRCPSCAAEARGSCGSSTSRSTEVGARARACGRARAPPRWRHACARDRRGRSARQGARPPSGSRRARGASARSRRACAREARAHRAPRA
jgi:translocation and assembly module TamB